MVIKISTFNKKNQWCSRPYAHRTTCGRRCNTTRWSLFSGNGRGWIEKVGSRTCKSHDVLPTKWRRVPLGGEALPSPGWCVWAVRAGAIDVISSFSSRVDSIRPVGNYILSRVSAADERWDGPGSTRPIRD